MNALVPAGVTMTFADVERLGAAIAASGLFGIKTREQAIALMMIAHAEGRHPALAARDFDIIQGRPSKKAEAMLRDFLEAGGRVEWHALDDTQADATFAHPQGGKARISWDMKRASTAGLGGKDMWKKFPRQMLRSRCVSEGVRTVWPMATGGMYEPGEVSDFTAPTIEHSEPPVESPPPTAARQAINAAVPMEPAKPRMTIGDWLDSVELALKDAGTDRVQVDKILFDARSMQIAQTLRNGALQRYNAMKAAAIQRANPAPPAEEEVPEEAGDAWPGPDVRAPATV